MKYISLFAGIGGFDLALDRLGHECVYTSEWDKHAAKVYELRFKRPVDTRDIRTVQTEEIPEHDLLVGGFPCQAFSVAGKRLGFDDTRGTLFFEIARILKDKQPKYFILENVKGLLSHNSGQTFRTIVSALTELGYDLQWNVLNSKNFGVPQNRERIYIVGHLRGQPRPEVFSFGESDSDTSKASEEDNITRTLTASYWKGAKGSHIVEKDVTRTITTTHAHSWGWNISYVINQLTKPPHSGNRVYGTDGIAPTVTTGKKVWIPEGTVLRRLTEVECERLQGFPDNWTEGVSTTQRYKCLGNAVTVNVVYEVAKNL
jgi:DNA (cytosine-5)-methyltransferase 1